MAIYSATGSATTTEPRQGFQDPKLAQVFSNKMHSQSTLPVGAIAGGIVGGFVLVFLIAMFFLLRKRQRMVAPPQLPEVSASVESQELQEHGLSELHDPRSVFELPSPPIELDSLVLKTTYG